MKVTHAYLRCVAIALLVGLVAFAPVRRAHAQVDGLRARLERLVTGGESVPRGSLDSIAYALDIAEQIQGSFTPQAEALRRRAAAFLDRAEQGVDPMPEQRGLITLRGYRSSLVNQLQGYSVYLPPGYDPARAYPLMVVLHGGSANGHLFLGVVLGNNMNWKEYDRHLWDELTPRWKPDWIVVAPDGFGQVMWRWMGERDVLDVIDDVQRHYNVDADRVVLGGLSNGGVGAYNLGTRHAWRFAAVMAMAGAPSWLQYAGGRMSPVQEQVLRPLSGMELIENAHNTDFRYFHGRTDGGPMKPRFVEELGERVRSLQVPHRETWYDAGHDLLYLVHRHGKIYDDLAQVRRNPTPSRVVVVTGDYRANRQHWLTVTGIAELPSLARVEASVAGSEVTVVTRGADALAIDLRTVPQTDGAEVRIVIDDRAVYAGPRAELGHVAHYVRRDGQWRAGFLATADGELRKRADVSGPIGDAFHDGMVHVYGTGKPSETQALKRVAEQGARGWPLWLWRHRQDVVADTDVTDELMRTRHLVLYGTPGSNAVLERIAARLPIRVQERAVVEGDRVWNAAGVGTRFIYPNPEAPERYVIVQAAPTLAGVQAGQRLPDFLADYVVYDAQSTATRPRLVFDARRPPLAEGFFDNAWKLPTRGATTNGETHGALQPAPTATPNNDAALMPADAQRPWSSLPVPPAPPTPGRPQQFAVRRDDPAGESARTIATRAAQFENLRATIPGGTWRVDERVRWKVQPAAHCLRELTRAKVRYEEWIEPLLIPVPVPVALKGRVQGVSYRSAHEDREVLVSCELARRMTTLSEVLQRHGIVSADVMSSYREQPRVSFHSFGLALDLMRFRSKTTTYNVLDDFERTPDHETCDAPEPSSPKAKLLRAIACELAASNTFSSVLTPNYNEGHRDHIHIDVRPDDPRVFIR